MLCPFCGNKLKEEPRIEIPEIDWSEATKEEIDEWDKQKDEEDLSVKLVCTNTGLCKDFVFFKHSPFGGINSAPGDSWSLTWLK